MSDIDMDDVDADPDYNPNGHARRASFPIVYRPSHEDLATSTAGISSSSDSEELDGEQEEEQTRQGKTTKKRTLNPKKWKRNMSKRNRAEGKSYEGMNKKRNVVKPPRQTGPDCECKFQCFQKIADSERQTLLRVFNKIGDKEKQDIFLGGQIHLNEVQRRRSRRTNDLNDGGDRRRIERPHTVSCVYKVKNIETETRVCKKAFCSIFGIGKARVERLIHCMNNQNPCPRDLRGTHSNRPNRIPENVVSQIDDHIKSFPKRQSHYSRTKNDNKYYLSPELNMNKMHKLYLQKYEPDTFRQMNEETDANLKPLVTYDFFCRHFQSNYNYSFGKPRSDTCQKCDMLNRNTAAETDEEQKKTLCVQKEIHLKKANYFYKDYKDTLSKVQASNGECELLAFDYQQNMPLPHLTSGDVFFKRQLWVYNFCVYQGSTGKSFFFMYDETTAKKGQNEVVSFLHHFLEQNVASNVKTVYLYSDNCSAQNKNQTLVQYLFTLCYNQRYTNIIHRYPEPGHSFLPCDRSFGVIEIEKKKRERIYLPSEYFTLVKNCSKKFSVIPVDQKMFLDFSNILNPSFKKNITNKEKVKFTISKYRLIEYTQRDVTCSENASGTVKYSFNLTKPGAVPSLPSEAQVVYKDTLPVKKEKHRQVMELAGKYVPPDCMWFYNALKCDVVGVQVTVDMGEESLTDDDDGD